MKLFRRYLSTRKWMIALFGLFGVIDLVVFALYRLPVQAVAYGFALCILPGAVAIGLDYLQFYRRHIRLIHIRREILNTLENLPQPHTLLEADYQVLLNNLWDEKNRVLLEADTQKEETEQYYTLWVHQVKTPIAAMRLLLQAEEPDTKALEAELFRIEEYVAMVLGYLRSDSGSTDYLIRTYELDSILRQALRKYAPLFIRKKITLHYSAVDLKVVTDEKWLLFVIEQVLSNALKYTPSGSITITEAGGILTIADTGLGIAPEDLPRIFERGYTGCNGRADKSASGIGLFLCRRVCANLGHRIWADSLVGTGTRIHLDLNRKELEVE